MNSPPQPLSLAVIGSRRVQRRCHAILTRANDPAAALQCAALRSARRLLRRYRPSAIVLDAVTSPFEALLALPAIKQLSPASSIILIGTRPTTTAFLLEALRRGACGHVAAADLARSLPKALRSVTAGEAWLPRRLAAAVVADLRAPATAAPTPTRLRLLRGTGERVISSRRHRTARRRDTAPSPTKERQP